MGSDHGVASQNGDRITWQLDQAKATDIIELLTAMTQSTTDSGHFYVDVSKPAQTLVLSRNEHPPMTHSSQFQQADHPR